MFKLITVLFAIIAVGSIAQAHGEEKPGPHGGHIQMPADFHTEVIADADGAFRVYLLDLKFENPTIKNSSVNAYILKGKKKNDLKCEAMGDDHFHCTGQKFQKSGSLIVKAKRDGKEADIEAKYKLPLKPLETKSGEAPKEEMDHSKHH